MWKYSELKNRAWNVLNNFGYWTPFSVCIVTSLLAGGSYSGSASSSASGSASYDESLIESAFPGFENLLQNDVFRTAFIVGIIILCLFIFVLTFCWSAFVGGPITVGKNRFFMEHREGGAKFKKLFWAFGCGNYLNVAKTIFVYDIRIFLFTLLFIIPGIIKGLEYFMVPYILSENPGMDMEDVFELSKKMTNGEKMRIFLFDFSFIGWLLLGVITCGIGLLFLEPYMEASFAELYQKLREKALSNGFADASELPGFYPDQA